MREAGAVDYKLDSARHKRSNALLSFEEQMFFWTEMRILVCLVGGINGYFAEYEHAAELRGLNAFDKLYDDGFRYKEDRFCQGTEK
ncbi:hypothetical protein CS542_02175 [Pedobacter sp. IW39]|nr:hypothetical protein CS542_02175 [Pedobacter sp. IW39]